MRQGSDENFVKMQTFLHFALGSVKVLEDYYGFGSFVFLTIIIIINSFFLFPLFRFVFFFFISLRLNIYCIISCLKAKKAPRAKNHR